MIENNTLSLNTLKSKIFSEELIKNDMVAFIILFTFLEPAFFQSYKFIHYGFNIIRVFTFIWVSLYYILNKIRPTKFIISIFIYYLIILASTIYNNGSIIRFIINIIPQVGFLLFLEALLNNNILKTLGILKTIYSILIYTNLFLIFLFPNGYNNYYANEILVITHFLGNRNLFVLIIIPAILISVLHSVLKDDKINYSSIILIISGITTVFKTKSATSTIGVILMTSYLLIFFNRKKINQIITGKILSLSYLFIYLGIVVFRQQEKFSFLIQNILGKSMTLSSRTLIWDQVIKMIKNKPIFGHGFLGNSSYVKMPSGNIFHPHNYFLHIFFTGGIILGIWIIYVFLKIMMNLDREKTNLCKFILFTIFTVLIVMIVGVHPFIPVLLILTISTHIKEINHIKRLRGGR